MLIFVADIFFVFKLFNFLCVFFCARISIETRDTQIWS